MTSRSDPRLIQSLDAQAVGALQQGLVVQHRDQIFGWIAGDIGRYARGLGWGALYGAVWWVIGGLVLMPILLGMPALAPVTMPPMRPVAMGSLIGHLTYGLILGGVYVGFVRRWAAPATQLRRAA